MKNDICYTKNYRVWLLTITIGIMLIHGILPAVTADGQLNVISSVIKITSLPDILEIIFWNL